jgi:membrane-bound metal-dependent hydrolase YbcI (DUF457 family)
MHKDAHRVFALGVCSVLCLAFGLGPGSVVLLSLLAGATGALPDSDQRIPFARHRGFTHGLTFALLVSFSLTVVSSYVQWALSLALSLPQVPLLNSVFTPGVELLEGVPVPGPVAAAAAADPAAFFASPFLRSWAALFAAVSSHIVLDVITPSGIDLWRWHLSGGVLSQDAALNRFFVVSGALLGVGSAAVSTFRLFLPTGLTTVFVSLGLAAALAIPVAISLHRKRQLWWRGLKCYSVNGLEFCTRRRCVRLKGEKVCVVRDKRRSAD